MRIRELFEPKSVAVLGASEHPGKIGYRLLENIVSGGYEGAVYPVNPKGGEILGKKVYKSVTEIKGGIDLAVMVIPAKFVYDEVVQCSKAGVKFLSIITSGFSEVGNNEEERKIVDFARSHGMRILGPNIFGTYSASASLNATFGPRDITKGSVSIITQSGALGIAMIGKTAVEHIGLSSIISVGNKSDINESDLLEYLIEDKTTKIIMMYIEGVQRGDELVGTLKKAAKIKPVIVIKSGRSKRGAMAAASHTGSLAGADEVFDDIMRQCGVMRAESLNEAFDWAKFLSEAPKPTMKNTVIITNGGGVGVMATDACEKYGVELYDNPAEMKEIFSKVTPDFGSTKNPIDLTGQASAEDYDLALRAAIDNPRIGSVIALYCETALFDLDKMPKMMASIYEAYQKKGKPIVFSLLGGEKVATCLETLSKARIPVFEDVYQAVSCLGRLYAHRLYIDEKAEIPVLSDIDTSKIGAIVENAQKDGRNFLLANECRAVMDAVGITLPKSIIARNFEEAVKAAESIGYPVVMKVVSRDILHKSDVGGVALDLENKADVINAYEAIMHNCRKNEPHANITGVEVAEMVTKGVELIVGARKDNSFGPVVMCGLGGIYVEVMKDVAFRAAPLSAAESLAMIKDIRSYPLLLGVRGEERKDIEGVVDAIIKAGTIISKCPYITDLEINPLTAYERGKGVKAVDVRILISKNPGVKK